MFALSVVSVSYWNFFLVFGTTGIFFNECYFVVSFLFAFKFYFFCLTNDPILLFLFGIEKKKKKKKKFCYSVFCFYNTFVTFTVSVRDWITNITVSVFLNLTPKFLQYKKLLI